ncbi:MAG: cobalt ECF transporter T component CbiQ [Planctomycetes bacterium]|nr:cobalt ECF transporter T component CbiQ [Planctomycetota bacterium]
MHHAFIDRYARIASPIHRMDPRAKLAAVAVWIVSINVTPFAQLAKLGATAAALAVLIALSRVPPAYIAKRSLVVLPFAVSVAAFGVFFGPGPPDGALRVLGLAIPYHSEGLRALAEVSVKAYLSVTVALLLVSTTPFSEILRGLAWYRVPRVFVLILGSIYRYLFLLADQGLRMRRARQARAFGRRGLGLRPAASLIATLLARTYARADRVYLAMAARGFDGTVRTLRPVAGRARDWAVAGTFAAAIVALTAWEAGTWWTAA